jgi:uncharacterized protein (TIGR00730 family)
MNVTIFGGSSPQPASPEYDFARQLGNGLAMNGHVVITGGYMGIMEAVSRGAAEAGGHVIGVTCEEIERWRKNHHNKWVLEEWREVTLQDRITKLIDSCDLAIALPGGGGTLAEIILMWNRIQIQAIPSRPILLQGEGWKNVLLTFFEEQEKYIPALTKNVFEFHIGIEDILYSVNRYQKE